MPARAKQAESKLKYARAEIDVEGGDSLAQIALRIAAGTEVLDLGTASGILGRHLKAMGCQVDGLELDEAAAAQARPAYRDFQIADLEVSDLGRLFPNRRYDAVVCADVLEHLRDPARVLRQLQKLVKPQGKLLISVPNVGYAGVVLDLLRGRFDYRKLGVLDETHLRFFTRSTLARLLAHNGWAVRETVPIRLELAKSEFHAQAADALSSTLAQTVCAQLDALTYQFIVEATPGAGGSLNGTVVDRAQASEARFSGQVHWRSSTQEYDPGRSVTAYGELHRDRQVLRLKVPIQDQPLAAIRIDPVDQPCAFQIHRFSVNGSAGEALWTASPEFWASEVGAMHQTVTLVPGTAPVLWATGDDPFFELQVSEQLNRGFERGAEVAVELSLIPLPELATSIESQLREAERLRDENGVLRASLGREREANATAREVLTDL
ncbi:MAG TPA: class I SAM-dependent methyltransferase, partial [Myxococcaceae bacterium]|nr:class I SAM-dependent methyltransferase [Myxococcaceae bacterium]